MTEDSNRRETGGRKLEARPDAKMPDPLDTGDRGDKPREPYGLTEPLDDHGAETRHHDGTQPPTSAEPPPDRCRAAPAHRSKDADRTRP